jgi:hypothetical protein
VDSLADFERRMAALDERLRPIAHQPVDLDDPSWLESLEALPTPLDEAGIRSQGEALVDELGARYERGAPEEREAIRGLFARYRLFAWAADVGAPTSTADGFRRHLLLFSMNAHTMDPRDAMGTLATLCEHAKTARIDAAPILRAVADLSSDDDIGMGASVHRLLLRTW